MSEWAYATIEDVAEVFDGPHATPTKTTTGPWFLSISSLDGGRLRLSESAHLSENEFDRWTRRVTPQEGDLLFSYETRLGEAALMPHGVRACLGRRMGLLRPRRDAINPRFLLYVYLSPDFQEVIRQRSVHGATVDRIPLTELPKWSVRLPPTRREQDAIAAVLGALDDKIATDERASQTALELGGSIYAAASRASSWTEITLERAARWYSGGTPNTAKPSFWNGDIPWISAASLKSPLIDDSDRRVTDLGAGSGTRIVPKGSVLFVVRGMSLKTEFRVGIARRQVAFGQDCKALVPLNGIEGDTLFHAIRNRTFDILDLVDEAGHGTGRLATDRIEQMVVRVPSSPSDQVNEILQNLNEVAASRQRESRTLTEMRHLLLSKLMSGEIRVRDAEKIVEEAL